MNNKWRKRAPLFILMAIAAFFAFSGVAMVLWNAILPTVLHVGAITYWQAMGLMILFRILFGGFRGRRPFMRRGWHMHGNCRDMDATEREKFKAEMRERMQQWHGHNEEPSATV